METGNHDRFELDELFDFERLDVYRLACEHLEQVIIEGEKLPSKASKQRDHLDRAADSILFNIAEGSAKPRGSRDRKRFFDIAQASAKECAAVWTNLQMRSHVSRQISKQARELLRRIVSMLIRLE